MFLTTVLQSLSAVCVLLIVIGFGVYLARKGLFEHPMHRTLLSKLVNMALPCFLFYSVVSKFTHDQLFELLKYAGLPFLTIGINLLISLVFIKLGWVRPHLKGTFIAAFTGSTVLFVGVPLIQTMYGAEGIPYLLIYFFANCVFIWTVGLYSIQLDGARKGQGDVPQFLSAKGLKMLFSPPLMGFLLGLLTVLLSIPVPRFIAQSTHIIGQIATPLALIFVGVTVWTIGGTKLKHLPREVWLVLLSCYLIRPITMYLCTLPMDMEPLMHKCFILASALPVSSVIAVLSKAYGGDEEFASEAIGASTAAMVPVLPFLLVGVSLI